MQPSFDILPIDPFYLEKLRMLGIETPTAIQAQAIPPITGGKDIVAQSQTGTGKTYAYLLPVLQRLDQSVKRLQAVVLVPTRELGMQISAEIDKLSEGSGVIAQSLIGGAAIGRQIEKLKQHPHIVVGTPGRILELLRQRKLSFHDVRTIVVDEVDHLFELGSSREIESVLAAAKRDRQILFFSATIPDAVREAADRLMREPQFIDATPEGRAAETLEHACFVCDKRDKIDMVRRLVRQYEPKSAILFINDVDKIGEVLAKLRHAQLEVEALYADAGKQERAVVMRRFREGATPLLLATDVAARGLDLPEVSHVINLDLPVDADHYVHRAGRTGRMGRRGTVLSLVAPGERFIIEKFEKALGIRIPQKSLFAGKVVQAKSGPARAVRTDAQQARPAAKRPGPAKPGPAAAQHGTDRSPKYAADAAQPTADRTAAAGRREGNRTGNSAAYEAQPGNKRNGGTENKPRQKTGGLPSAKTSEKRDKSTRERDRKNKGAPRWLKAKKQDPQ